MSEEGKRRVRERASKLSLKEALVMVLDLVREEDSIAYALAEATEIARAVLEGRRVEAETIETAALRVDGEVWTLPRPARHHVLIYAWGMAHWRAGKGLTGSGGPGELPDETDQGAS